jgi:hypothetical protein
MPIKRVQFPDGSIKRIEVPEGATNEQIIAFVQSQQPANDLAMPDGSSATQAGQKAIEDARFYKRNLPTNGMSNTQLALAGVGKVFSDTGRGVQQLFGGRSQADVDFERQLDAPLMNTLPGTAGYIGGQAAALSVPVGDAANVLYFAGKAAPYIGAGLRSAAFEATQPVGTGETRAGNALQAGVAGVAGQGIATGLNAAARGAVMHLDAPARALA